MSWCDAFTTPQAKCVYFALVVVILILAVLRVKNMAELLENPNYLYTSGATQRFHQEDTSANRGDYTTGYIFQAPVPAAMRPEVAHAAEVSAAVKARRANKSEAMTASPDEMDLWAVGQDLGAYKDGITGQTRGLDAGRHGMGMKNMTTENMQDDVYENLLHQQALNGA